jgi:hypothetical protein
MSDKLVYTFLFGILLCVSEWSPLTAQESAAQKPWWNPFAGAGASSTRDSTFFNGGGGKSSQWPRWKWPSLTRSEASPSPTPSGKPASGDSLSRQKGKPSGFSKFSTATKKFWSDTADFINPFDQPAQPQKQGYRPQDMEQSRSSGGFSSWFKPKPPEKEIHDVNGFLSQPRPRF